MVDVAPLHRDSDIALLYSIPSLLATEINHHPVVLLPRADGGFVRLVARDTEEILRITPKSLDYYVEH